MTKAQGRVRSACGRGDRIFAWDARNRLDIVGLDGCENLRGFDCVDEWDAKQRARRGAQDLRIEWVHTALCEDHSGGAKRFRRARDCAGIARS